MSHRQLIDALGKGTQVAAWLSSHVQKIDREAVYKWQKNGVPWRWRPHVARMAVEKGVKLPKNFSTGLQ